jgi:hypothetical protein
MVVLPDGIFTQEWSIPTTVTSIVLTMTVNAVVTGLIVFKIFKVFTQVKPTSDGKTLGTTRSGSKLLPIMFVLIESGMVLFAVQIVHVVLTVVLNEPADVGFHVAIGIHEMLNVIITFVVTTVLSY